MSNPALLNTLKRVVSDLQTVRDNYENNLINTEQATESTCIFENKLNFLIITVLEITLDQESYMQIGQAYTLIQKIKLEVTRDL